MIYPPFGAKTCWDIFSLDIIRFLSNSQFSSSCAFGKLLAPRNRRCLHTNVRGYLQSKWRLFLLYVFVDFRESKLFPKDSRQLKAGLGISESHTKILPWVEIHKGKRSRSCLLRFQLTIK